MDGIKFGSGAALRKASIQNGVTVFTSLDTVRIMLDVLEDAIPAISTIDG